MSYIGKNVAPQPQGTYSQSEIDTQMLTKSPTDSPVFTGDLRADRLIAYGSGGIETNVAVGGRSLNSNTTGYYNVAVGEDALLNNTTGNHNVANGYNALKHNTTGYGNTSIGKEASYFNTTGCGNTAIGQYALLFAQDGSQHTTFSNCSGLGYDTRVGGNYATAIGYNASAPANCVALGTSSERTLVGGAVDNGVDRLQVNGSISAGGVHTQFASKDYQSGINPVVTLPIVSSECYTEFVMVGLFPYNTDFECVRKIELVSYGTGVFILSNTTAGRGTFPDPVISLSDGILRLSIPYDIAYRFCCVVKSINAGSGVLRIV